MPAWISRHVPRPSATARVFCFPPAGHGAAFRAWSNALPQRYELCAVELPGHGARLRETPLSSIPRIIDGLSEALLPELDRPFIFFGHSMGAVLAAALARRLAAHGEPCPAHLFVSARRPPRVFDPSPPLRELSDQAFVNAINRRYAGMPQEVLNDPELLALLLPALRADVAALERYAPGVEAPLDCPITACGGLADTATPRLHLEAWRSETLGSFRLRLFAGGHFYLTQQRAALLDEITLTLDDLLRLPSAVAGA